MKFRWSRPLGGEIRSTTLSRKDAHWFVSFLVDDQDHAPEQHAMPNMAVGIDRGVKSAAVTSNGDFHHRESIMAGETVRYRRRLQQRLARPAARLALRRAAVAAPGGEPPISKKGRRRPDRRREHTGKRLRLPHRHGRHRQAPVDA